MSSCYINKGVSLDTCEVSTGGIKKIWVAGGGQITGVTETTGYTITGITSTSGTTLYEFNLRRGVSNLVQNVNKSYENASLFFEQVLTVVLYKYDADKRNLLLLLAVNDFLQIFAEDNNGIIYYLGEVNGMSLSGSSGTGTALADRNGFELVFTGQEPEPAKILDASVTLADAFDGTIA